MASIKHAAGLTKVEPVSFWREDDMKREDVYTAIDKERIAQDETWRKGRPIEAQYKFAAPHVLLLEECVAKLRSFWYISDKENLRDRLIKIAAVAVRALEEIDHQN